jgi:hypothetical protein
MPSLLSSSSSLLKVSGALSIEVGREKEVERVDDMALAVSDNGGSVSKPVKEVVRMGSVS